MNATMEKTVREVVLQNPAAARTFEKLGIDYCCGGHRTLDQACQTAGVPVGEVLAALDKDAAAPLADADRDWRTASLSALIAHIRDTHHRFTRSEIQRLVPLFEKVVAAHGANHPELGKMRDIFLALAEELSSHLRKEEMVLFPYIERMDEAVNQGRPVMPPPFGTVRNPVAMMVNEHDGAGDALRELRRSSNGFAAPPDACLSYQTLYSALAGLEADLHQHIHLENNILFPRAIQMEQGG